MPASFAPVNNRPLSTFSNPDAYGLHYSAAVRFSVSRLYIEMEAGKAVWTVVAMFASRSRIYYRAAAYFTRKAVFAAVRFIIAFS